MTLVPSADHGYGQAVQQYQPQNLQPVPFGPPPQQPSGVMRLTEWAEEARAAAALASSLVKTSFVPKAFQGRVEEAAAAILTGAEMGLSPMASLRAIYLIHGTPGMYAKTMRAVVQSHGHEVWVHEATATRVIVRGRRKGSDQIESSTWTQDRAKTAGLLTNDQYRKNPQNMLTARATAEVCWLIASDALHGIAASVEELEAGGENGGVGEPPEEAAPAKRTAKRKPLERAEATEPALAAPGPVAQSVGSEPPVDDAPATDDRAFSDDPFPVERSGDRPASEAKLKAMFASFNEVGITDKDGQLDYIEGVIGRRVESRKELTSREASAILDSLQRANTFEAQPVEGES